MTTVNQLLAIIPDIVAQGSGKLRLPCFFPLNDNAVIRNRAMIVLGIGATAIATATLATFSLLLHSSQTREPQTPVF